MIEVLVTAVLVTVAVVGVLNGIRATQVTAARARDADVLQRLASEKLEDLKLLSDPSGDGARGDFSDRGYPDTTWTVNVQSTSVTNLDEVTVTALKGSDSQALTTLIYVPPLTGSTSATTGATTGGTTP